MKLFRCFLIVSFFFLSFSTGFCKVNRPPVTMEFDACFIHAGQRYQIDPKLLKVISQKESSLIPGIVNYNRDKKGKIISIDYGLMQVNSAHIPELKNMGIIREKKELLDNPCLNIHIGAWILAKHFKKCGINWSCLGSYNAGFDEKNEVNRMNYARGIYERYVPGVKKSSG
ncbi:lytic transglycosylase domain-containing protein [Salmonella enterica]|nr:lytic transglycosylase domain-containing protein [Salmonella enterica]